MEAATLPAIRRNFIFPLAGEIRLSSIFQLFLAEPDSYQKRVESIPRGCPGRTEWLVSPVIMLLSPGSIHLTGQTIFVDGGCTAGDTFVMETRRFGA